MSKEQQLKYTAALILGFMKRILIILLLSACMNSNAQNVNNPELDKFIGTWCWTSNADTINIFLQKQTITLPNGNNREVMVGWHKYVKNGQLVQSSMQNIGLNYNNEETPLGTDPRITLFGFTRKPTEIWFTSFWDLTLHKNCHMFFELLPNSTTQAKWILTNPNGVVYDGPAGTQSQFTFPRNLVLTKQ